MSPVLGSRSLLPQHLAMLREGSGLPDDVIAERGYWSATAVAELLDIGFGRAQAIVPALVVPLWNVSGEQAGVALRPDSPRIFANGRIAKYEQPTGSRMILDVPPRCRAALGDPSTPLLITEGAKKADAAAMCGACAINLSGVWNWRGTNPRGGKTVLPDWESVALNGRLVRIVFDSDVATKAAVAGAVRRLKALLEQRHAHVEIIYLPALPNGEKQGLDDFLAAGGCIDQLSEFANEAVRSAVPACGNLQLPEIVVSGRFLPEITNDCYQEIVAWNRKAPTLFKRDERLVRVRKGGAGGPAIVELVAEDVVFALERRARFTRVLDEKRGFVHVPASLPNNVVQDILVAWQKPVPSLKGIVHTPVVARDGTVETKPGYQEKSQLYYSAIGTSVALVPEAPNGDEVDDARALLLDEWLVDFPFTTEASRAHVVAAALTPLVREMILGPTPLFVVTAPIQGSGKGYIAQSIGILVTGSLPAVMTEARDGDEMRKRITAVLRDGAPMVLIDNVKQRLDSKELAAVLTAEFWTDRLLGVSETVRLPNRCLWMATGNNVELDGEIGRRSVEIRIDPKVDRPWERGGFRHDPFLPWVSAHRHELVRALLVLARHWIAVGTPRWTGKPMGTFEDWSQVAGGILDTAGIGGFLANRDELYSRSDSETEEWRAFVGAWWERHEGESVKAGQLSALVKEFELLPGLVAAIRGEPTEQALKIRLGKALAQRLDRNIGGWFVRRVGQDGHQKGTLYRLEAAESAPGVDQPSADSPQEND